MKKIIQAFTFVESVIVIGILAIIFLIALQFFLPKINPQILAQTVAQIESLIKEARSRAEVQQEQANWGVRFSNDLRPYFALFKGETFATSAIEIQNYLSKDLIFLKPTKGEVLDLVFAKNEATLLSGATVEIWIAFRKKPTFGKKIIVSPLGMITIENL